jgi:predicted MPP superfamily phosphohydrolase
LSEQKKLVWIKKVSPLLYDIAMAALCLYIGFRGRRWLNMLLPFESGWIPGTLLLLYYVLDLMALKHLKFTRKRNLVYTLSICTFCVLYLSMSMLAVDIVQLIIKIFVHEPNTLRTIFIVCGFLCVIFVVCAVIYGMEHAKKIVTVNYESICGKLDQDRRVVLLSDLHIGYFVGKEHIRRIAEAVNSLNPDIVVISGDIFNGGGTEECSELSGAAEELRSIQARYGVYAVTGNHDPSPSDEKFLSFIQDSGIILLQDELCDAGGMVLAGRPTKTRPRKTLGTLLKDADRGKPILVIDHDPMGICEAREKKADYVMCGHTHRGQVFPLNLFVRFLYEKDEVWGISKSGPTTSLVTSGAGFFSMPMRTGSDSEVVCLDIKAGGQR